jgi:Domain of unknown function (DUF4190)
VSWQPPSEDWQSALEQPEDWQAQLERKGIPKEPLWSREPVAATPAPAAAAPEAVAPPVADPVTRRWEPAPQRAGTRAPAAPNAIGSFVLGLIGLWVWFLGPVAVYQGLKARRAIDRSGGQLGGRTIATIGVVLGVLETVGLIISVVAIGLAVSVSLD